ncbi:hypothetical protein GCM10010404_91280 [Nonomuraea africana]
MALSGVLCGIGRLPGSTEPPDRHRGHAGTGQELAPLTLDPAARSGQREDACTAAARGRFGEEALPGLAQLVLDDLGGHTANLLEVVLHLRHGSGQGGGRTEPPLPGRARLLRAPERNLGRHPPTPATQGNPPRATSLMESYRPRCPEP